MIWLTHFCRHSTYVVSHNDESRQIKQGYNQNPTPYFFQQMPRDKEDEMPLDEEDDPNLSHIAQDFFDEEIDEEEDEENYFQRTIAIAQEIMDNSISKKTLNQHNR
jgi:hypothetical protein